MRHVTSAQEGAGRLVRRPAGERGRTELDWLHGRHTFSFGDYHAPDHMGFRSLRVINEDVIEPGRGFDTHPHRDAEIFTYVIEGSLQHRDSMGNGSVIVAGDLQYMSAGRGVRHSEYNPSPDHPVHLLQIWLQPGEKGGEPRYAEKKLGSAARPDALTPLFSGSGRDGTASIRQDAEISFGKLGAGRSLTARLKEGRHAWIQVIKGRLGVLGHTLEEGDGGAISEATQIAIVAEEDAEFLFFDLA